MRVFLLLQLARQRDALLLRINHLQRLIAIAVLLLPRAVFEPFFCPPAIRFCLLRGLINVQLFPG
jgi:hypothetical protein